MTRIQRSFTLILPSSTTIIFRFIHTWVVWIDGSNNRNEEVNDVSFTTFEQEKIDKEKDDRGGGCSQRKAASRQDFNKFLKCSHHENRAKLLVISHDS